MREKLQRRHAASGCGGGLAGRWGGQSDVWPETVLERLRVRFEFVSITFEPRDDVSAEAGVLGDLADEGFALGGGLERGDLIRQRFDLLVGRFELRGVVAFAGVVFGGFGLVFVVFGVSGFEFRFLPLRRGRRARG
ncbi:MAG: hypothetical protein ACLUAM_09610 [Bifidobacterium adolescentis]